MSNTYRLSLLAVFSLLSLSARAETAICTEIVPPVTITQPGVYCLFKDYALNLAEGAAITVSASNVVLDFNGHRVGNPGAGTSSTAVGVLSGVSGQAGYKNIAVRNGTLISFYKGVQVTGGGSQGHVIEDMLIDRSLFFGLDVDADASVLRRNRVVGTGSIGGPTTTNAGIAVYGDGVVVAENEVLDTRSKSGVVGIYAARGGSGESAGSVVVSGNRVIGLTSGAQGDETGLWILSPATVRDNMVLDTQAASGGTTRGVHGGLDAKILNNVVSVVGTAYLGGVQIAGTNN